VYAPPIQELVDELGRLPGIGPKSAQRIAFHILKSPAEDVSRLANVIGSAKVRVTWCRHCFNFAEAVAGAEGEAQCEICANPRRDPSVLCVVEEPRHVVAIEKSGWFKGRYHVLMGALSPIDGVFAEQLRIKELLTRIETEGVTEVILCTDPDQEGSATAMYLRDRLKELPQKVKVTQIPVGLPVGSEIEFADELTLARALEDRREVS
jgi:recombination protein RecR